PSNSETFDDDILVFGIPKEDMTEPVRKAIDLLIGQINSLRSELMSAHGHEAYLEDQVEKDRLLHIMRRTVLMARMGLAARRVEEEHVSFCVLYFNVKNSASVRLEYGAGAVESMLLHAADIMREGLDPGDLIGTLEDSDFGVVLPGTVLLDAVQKGHDLVQRIGAYSFDWQGQQIGIETDFGVTEIVAGDSGDDIIERARSSMESSENT
ncbi:MAG: GGDEF domain-containing protein, partial [Magnetovibrio sp.]|nr:GGDEF domain-containing protein [Magnetovibrio sp.]